VFLNQRIFESLHLIDKNYKYTWGKMENSKQNKPFLVILWYYKFDFCHKLSYIQFVFFTILENSIPFNEKYKDEDGVIKDMTEMMMIFFFFDKYWDEYRIIFVFGAILDLIMKLEILVYYKKNRLSKPIHNYIT